MGSPVLDYDDLVVELGGDRYAATPEIADMAGRLWVARIPRVSWVVWSGPTVAQRARFVREHHAMVFVVTAAMDVCIERARVERPPGWEHRVRDWFARWQPHGEHVIRTDGDAAWASQGEHDTGWR